MTQGDREKLAGRIERAGKFTVACDEHDRFVFVMERTEASDIAAALRSTAHAAPAVPEGWKLVPVEPTQEMVRAAKQVSFFYPEHFVGHYRAMLAAAPQPPAEKRKCTGTKTVDGGSGGPRVPCDGVWEQGVGVTEGCGEPCTFVMHPETGVPFAGEGLGPSPLAAQTVCGCLIPRRKECPSPRPANCYFKDKSPSRRGEPAPTEESGPDMLARLRDNGALWAAEFRQAAIKLGYSDMDEGWLIGWFANAIENTEMVRREQRQKRDGLDPATLEAAAKIAEEACLVPPDGGSPTPEEVAVAQRGAAAIRALAKRPSP